MPGTKRTRSNSNAGSSKKPRKSFRATISRPISDSWQKKIYQFVQKVPPITVGSGAAGLSVQLAYQFQLSDIGNASTFTGLFDQFRLRKVVLTFRPAYTQAVVNATLTTATTYNISVIDYDDDNTLTDGQMLQYGNAQIHTNTEKFTRVIYPKVANAVYAGGLFSGFGNASPNQWIDCNTPATSYYGFKINFENNPTAAANTLGFIDKTYYLEFRNVR